MPARVGGAVFRALAEGLVAIGLLAALPSPAAELEPDVAVIARPDAAVDVRSDVAVNARPDAAVDPRSDAAVNARLDAAVDPRPVAAVNARSDAAVNARSDAAVNPRLDAAVDARPVAPANARPDAARDALAPSGTPLTLDEAETVNQPGEHQVRVSADGIAHVHLKPSANRDPVTVDLLLSTFKAAGQNTAIVVGFEDDPPRKGQRLAFRQNVPVPAGGADVWLNAADLAPGVEYVGTLSATIGRQRTLAWQITLLRPSIVPPFHCPEESRFVDADGKVDIAFRALAPTTIKVVGLRLSGFTSRDQELGEIGFAQTAGGALASELANYAIDGPNLTPPLRAQGLTEGATYTGTVRFLDGGDDIGGCSLSILMPKRVRAELVADTPTLSRDIVLPFLFGDSPAATLAVRLSEKSRSRQVDGITATLDGPSDSPSGTFNANWLLHFWIDGVAAEHFMEPSNAQADKPEPGHSIPRGGQMNVGLQLQHLRAGKYVFGMRFYGVDTLVPGPKIDVTVNVRHHWGWALAAIVIALALSYCIGKGITYWRERIRIRGQLAVLSAERYDEHIDLPSVVFLRAVIAETELLLRESFILPPPPSVYDYLARAERVASILRRYSAVNEDLEDAQCLDSVKYHYYEAIGESMRRIGPQPLDQKTTDSILEDLGVIDSRLADPITWYWATLKAKAKNLAEQARCAETSLGDPAVVGPLLEKLENLPAAADQSCDQAYWMMKLLYSRRAYGDDVNALTKQYAVKGSLAETLKVADQLTWARVSAAAADQRVNIKLADSFVEQESLRPCTFMLEFGDTAISESYLVTNILRYEWFFSLSGKRGKPPKTWSLVLNGPRVTQYMPYAGTLEVRAKLRWPAAHGLQVEDIAPITVDIGENSELSLVRSLDFSEVISMLLVTAVAVITGLSSLYLAKPTFGSFADYVAILAWAVGIDQGKNLIQLLKAYPVDADRGTGGGGAQSS